MERLTRRSADGRACFKPHLYGQMNKDVCDRLAAYEDTGLEPEDLKRAFNEYPCAPILFHSPSSFTRMGWRRCICRHPLCVQYAAG